MLGHTLYTWKKFEVLGTSKYFKVRFLIYEQNTMAKQILEKDKFSKSDPKSMVIR